MPSPFPGMNPYLESPGMWPDFHERLITALAAALAQPIAPGFYAKIEEQLYIHEHGETRHRPFGRPDVGVLPTRGGGGVERGVLCSGRATLDLRGLVPRPRLPPMGAWPEARGRERPLYS